MTENIRSNWKKVIQSQTDALEYRRTKAQSYPPGDAFSYYWGQYEDSCKTFIAGIEAEFGSVQDFNEFLKEDVRKKAGEQSVDMTTYLENWTDICEGGPVHTVASIGSKLEIFYEGALWGINKTVNERQPPQSGSPPKLRPV